MKKHIYFLLILLAFSCTKDIVDPMTIPIGYYEAICTFDNGSDIRKGIVKITESNPEEIIISGNKFSVNDKSFIGKLLLPSGGPYKIDAKWTYDKKTKKYIVNGSSSYSVYAQGGLVEVQYYGTFEMISAE